MNYKNPSVPQPMPSLTPAMAAPATSSAPARSLLDLMSEGFYLLMLLKRGQLPSSEDAFVQAVQRFLESAERGAARLNIPAEDVYASKYAFCAAVDEVILSQPSALRDAWEIHPLQLRLFGEHLAGEHFFDRLEQLRAQGTARLPSLEVYHYCLLLGFEGKYRLEGTEKLGYLTARLGDEITFLKGKRSGFAPHALPPDKIAHALRRVVPMWAPAVLLAVVGALAFLMMSGLLDRGTEQRLSAYNNVVQMPARTAHLTITLP